MATKLLYNDIEDDYESEKFFAPNVPITLTLAFRGTPTTAWGIRTPLFEEFKEYANSVPRTGNGGTPNSIGTEDGEVVVNMEKLKKEANEVSIPAHPVVPKLDLSMLKEEDTAANYDLKISLSDISIISWQSAKVNVPSFVPKLDLSEITSPRRYSPTELNKLAFEKVISQPDTGTCINPELRLASSPGTISRTSGQTEKPSKKPKKFKSLRKFIRNVYEFFSKCTR